jgi:flavin-dependent dehydrogenase
MSHSDNCDVAVIGGGPAGSLTATYLARAGYDVVLLEKQRHPRLTVGESLIPDFWKYCDEAGVTDKIMADGFIRKAGGTVDWHGETRRLAFRDFGYLRPALHVERDRFDEILLRHAAASGARIREEVAVQSVDLNGGAPILACRAAGEDGAGEVRCRVVVDASGQASLLGRQLGLRVMDDDFRFMSVWGYFTGSRYYGADGSTWPAESCREIPPTTYVSSIPGTGDWGWCWHIQMRESTSVGLVVPLDTMKTVKDGGLSWEEYLLGQCAALPGLRDLLSGARLIDGSVRVIRDYSYRTTRVAGPGYFLVGDAAGFIDPIFSIGVVLGMYSARAAAWAIERTFRAPQHCARHQAIYTSQVSDRMELARTLALPQYDLDGPASIQARKVMQFSNSQARSLMHAASSLTARSQHYLALVEEEPPARPVAERSGAV